MFGGAHRHFMYTLDSKAAGDNGVAHAAGAASNAERVAEHA